MRQQDRTPRGVLAALLCLASLQSAGTEAYTVLPASQSPAAIQTWPRRTISSRSSTRIHLQKGWFVDDDQESSDDEQEGLVTREKLQRDLLKDPKVRRRKGKGYQPLDNRDSLPFAVRKISPDPYGNLEAKQIRQQQNARAQSARRKRTDLDIQLTSSRLKLVGSGTDASTLLGEFPLDKTTTSGDIISLSNPETGRLHLYKVITARCQYKYAGGQRFVMVRKILEVKEVSRAWQEAQLEKQFFADSANITNATETDVHWNNKQV